MGDLASSSASAIGNVALSGVSALGDAASSGVSSLIVNPLRSASNLIRSSFSPSVNSSDVFPESQQSSQQVSSSDVFPESNVSRLSSSIFEDLTANPPEGLITANQTGVYPSWHPSYYLA